VLKELFQGVRVEGRGYPERRAFIEAAIRAEYVAMGIEVQKIPKSLDCNGGPRVYPVSGKGRLEELLKAIPDGATQIREKSAVIKEVTPEDLGHAEGEVPVGHGLKDIFTEPLPKLYYSFLMTGGAEVPALT